MEKVLHIAVGAGFLGLADIAGHPDAAEGIIDRQQGSRELSAVDGVDRGEELSVAGGMEHLLLVADIGKRDLGMRKRDLVDHIGNSVALRHIRLQKLHAGGNVVEQVTDDKGSAVGTAGVVQRDLLAAFDQIAGADLFLACLGDQLEVGYRGYGREGFAAEAEGGDRVEVVLNTHLGGRVAHKGGADILAQDARSVIGDAHKGDAAVFDLDGDGGCAGVDGVFDQFFDDGGRTFDDLTGGDQFCHVFVKNIDFAHGDSSFLVNGK